jgi:hypothetical protein
MIISIKTQCPHADKSAVIKPLHVDRDSYVLWECHGQYSADGSCDNVALTIWSRDYDISLDQKRRLLDIARTNSLGCIDMSEVSHTLENSTYTQPT